MDASTQQAKIEKAGMTQTVVHFLDSDLMGGAEQVVLSLLAGLDRCRWRPILFHRDAPGVSQLVKEASELGIACHAVPRMTTQNLVKTLPRFVWELSATKATIFHAHMSWALGCRFGIIGAWLCRIPGIVATSHLCSPISDDVRFRRLKQTLQAGIIHRYVAVSRGVKECLCKDIRVPESKVRVVQNGIPLAPFAQSADPALRASLTKGQDRPIIFTPARLHSQKGHIYLLEAAALVPDALFVLAGDGPERTSLQQLARQLGLGARVRFLGHRRDIPQLLATCDLFVLPSLYEGLPLSLLEAMAAGKPVIATAIPGNDEAVNHGTTGLLVAPRNPVELASAIRSLLSNMVLAARLGEAARTRVTQQFSSQAMVHATSEIYAELLKSPHQIASSER